MTGENSAREDEKRRAEYARKLVREKRNRTELQSGKCRACGVPCDLKYGIYCTICYSKQHAMRAEATRKERESQEKRRADRQKRREEMIKLEKQKEKMRKEWKERRRIEELERRAERERAERKRAQAPKRQTKKEVSPSPSGIEEVECGNCYKTVTIDVAENDWLDCPYCPDWVCCDESDSGCMIHTSSFYDAEVCADCCGTDCEQGDCAIWCEDCDEKYKYCRCDLLTSF